MTTPRLLWRSFGAKTIEIPQVKITPIARGHAGKTACICSLYYALRDVLPGGLRFGFNNPIELTTMLDKYERFLDQLSTTGLAQTEAPTLHAIRLMDEKHNVSAVTKITDVMGQVLRNTTESSDEKQMARYRDYIARLAQSDVLWAIVSPPDKADPRSIAQFGSDHMIAVSFLREALKRSTRPVTVAIVISKFDILTSIESVARQMSSESFLREMVAPLVKVVEEEDFNNLVAARIFPVSVFGFGNAIKIEGSEDTQNVRTGEARWRLKENAIIEPFNLMPLLVYSISNSLRHQFAKSKYSRQILKTCDRLDDALEQLGGVWCSLKIKNKKI